MGSKKTKQKTTTSKPAWVEEGAKTAMSIGNRLAGQQYSPYEGQRVAGLSANETAGINLARDSTGIATPYIREAGALARRGSQSFTEADMADYMNPYIKGALDPAAREIREQGARNINDIEGRISSIDAFGGSRGALMRSEALEKTNQSISDLYATGMSAAFDRATALWGADRAKDLQASGRLQEVGTALQQSAKTDVSTLMASGAVDRGVQQSMLDFDYKQFIEGRDWDFRSLGAMLTTLQGISGSVTQTQETTTEQSGGELAQIAGLAAVALGAFFGGPAGAAAVGSAVGTGTESP